MGGIGFARCVGGRTFGRGPKLLRLRKFKRQLVELGCLRFESLLGENHGVDLEVVFLFQFFRFVFGFVP